MFYIGIDIAKHKRETSIIDSDGKLLCESIPFSNTQKGCEKLLALMQKFAHAQNKISKRGSPYLRRAIWSTAGRAAF